MNAACLIHVEMGHSVLTRLAATDAYVLKAGLDKTVLMVRNSAVNTFMFLNIWVP